MKYFFSLFLVTLGAASAAPVPPPDKLLAADTLAVLTIADYKKARADWDRWPMAKLWNDTAMKAFREKI